MRRKFHHLLLFLILFHHSLSYENFGHVDHKHFAKNVNADSDAPVISDISAATSPCAIKVYWDCSSTCHENLNGFTVYWQQTGSEENAKASESSKSNNYIIGGLIADQSYTIWVASVKDDGEHNSDQVEISTNPGDPQKVTGVEVMVESDTIIAVSWDSTSNPCPIKGYSITWTGTALWDESLNPTGSHTASEDTTNYVAAYLTPYTDYEFYVSEIAIDGIIGKPSDTKTATTEEGPAGPPESVASTTLSSSRAEINWTPPYEKNGVIKAYHILTQLLSDTDDHWDITIESGRSSIIIDGLLPCGDYSFSVDAINGAGFGEAGTSVSRTNPGPPPDFTSFTYANITSTSVFLTWEPLDTFCPVLKYSLHGEEEILWSEGIEPFNIEFKTEDNYYLLDYLIPWSAYQLSIKATTEGGTTDSISQTVETLEDAAGPPAPVNSSTIDSQSVWVSWTSPKKENGDISGYHISCANGDTSDDKCDVTTGNVFSYSIKNLDAGSDYNFTVQAINGFGYGEGAETDSTTLPEK